MVKISPSQLKALYLKRSDDGMSIDMCSSLIKNLKEGFISQIIFDFGIDRLHILINILKEFEEYESLAVIRDKLKTHNKVNKTDYQIDKDV